MTKPAPDSFQPAPELAKTLAPERFESSHTRPLRGASDDPDSLTGPEATSFTIRLMKADKAKILEDAALAGINPSEYARQVLLGKKIEAKQPLIESQAIAKLESIRGLLKQLWKTERFDSEAVFSAVNQTLAWIRKGRS